jgi:hypothetical protein
MMNSESLKKFHLLPGSHKRRNAGGNFLFPQKYFPIAHEMLRCLSQSFALSKCLEIKAQTTVERFAPSTNSQAAAH